MWLHGGRSGANQSRTASMLTMMLTDVCRTEFLKSTNCHQRRKKKWHTLHIGYWLQQQHEFHSIKLSCKAIGQSRRRAQKNDWAFWLIFLLKSITFDRNVLETWFLFWQNQTFMLYIKIRQRATWNDMAGHIWPAGLVFDTPALHKHKIQVHNKMYDNLYWAQSNRPTWAVK